MTIPARPQISLTDERDALDSISRMLVGSKMLQDEPGVVYTLAAQKAHPADALAIDQFMQGLEAEKQVNLARAAGATIHLDTNQRLMLDQNGVAYDDVLFTQKDAAQQAVSSVMQQTNGEYTAKLNADGTLALGKDGSIQREKTHESDSGGWFSSFGSFADHIGGALKGAGADTLHGLSEGYNFVAGGIEKGVEGAGRNILGIGGGGSDPNQQVAQDAVVQSKNTDTQDMAAQGYDPNSFWSTMAFQASGKAHSSLSGLNDTYGDEKVNEALKFLDDPHAYRESILNDPNSYVKSADGQTSLTPEASAKVQYVGSKDFEELARKVNAHQATVGNDIANALGIDPVHHSTAYALTSAGANVAASFVIDPTLLALQGVKVAKLATVGLDSLGDSEKAASILTRDSNLPWVKDVQRGWLRAIKLGGKMREANAAGDTTQLAKLTAQFQAELPALKPLMGEFIGEHALTGWEESVVDGKRTVTPILGKTGGIQSLEDAAEFIKSKHGLNLLYSGRAATQSSLMPGALSAFGYRKLKSAVAGWMTSRSAIRQEGAYETALSRFEADPTLAKKWLDEGYLEHSPARPDDAVNAHTDSVIAYPAAENASSALGNLMGLLREGAPAQSERMALQDELDTLEARLQDAMASKTSTPDELEHLHDSIDLGRQLVAQSEQGVSATAAQIKMAQRALQDADASLARTAEESAATDTTALPASQQRALQLTYAGKGAIARNLRSRGDALGEASKFGWASPTAVAARSRLAAQRFSTLLPRNTVMDIEDSMTGDKIYQYALTYLNRGDAAGLKAAYVNGGAAERKTVIRGLIDQVSHAAGLGQTQTGRDLLNRMKTAEERYAVSGDEIELDGQKLGLFEGQTRTQWTLPSFQALQHAASKIGLWEATIGRGLTSGQADALMGQWKMFMLFKPSTVTRNQLEGWGRTALDGKLGSALKARALATTRNKELWDKGYALDSPVRQEWQAAMDVGDTKLAKQIERGSMLAGDVLGRSVTGSRIADLAPLALAGRAYRALVGKAMDEETVQALLTMDPEELSRAMEGYGQQILENELGHANAARQSTEVAKAGYGPAKVRAALHRALSRPGGKGAQDEVHYSDADTAGAIGADRYANALGMRVNAMPNTARAAIAMLRKPDAQIEDVVKAMESETKNSAFGKVFFENPAGEPNKARWAVTDNERELGKRDWAQKVVNEYETLLHGQNGELQHGLADYIETHGEAPGADWIIKNLKGDHRPETVIHQEVMAMPNGGLKSMAQVLQDVQGAGYQWMVERPLQRTTSSPVFLANYAMARKGLNAQVEQMVEHGISREAAENMAKDLSIRNAWVKSEQLIDDPGQKTQFDVIARNMFPFARATNAMIRRWGTGLWQNPAAARKMMLAGEGAVHSGLIYDNIYGEPTFTYPGSGVLNMAMREIAKIPGFENVAAFPVASDMTGGVLMSVPGADNPFRMSMGPMISIPLREVYKHLLPAAWRGDAMSIDEFVNGPVGTGETFSQLMPTAVRKFYIALDGSQRNSALASSMNGAFANLAAAGLVPPPNASDAEVQQFRTRLQTQVQNHLFLRAVFGLFSPAAPSTPTEGTAASGADYAWQVDGIKQLSDEYKSILNEVGGDSARANAVFTALHPDEVVFDAGNGSETKLASSAYETPKSHASAKGAFLPATESALNWLASNEGFVQKYKSVAAYFLPNEASNEPFSDAAYRAQLELGLRIRKTPEEFMKDVYVKHAESAFYPSVQEYDRRIEAAKAAGDEATMQSLKLSKSNWERDYKSINRLFGAKIDNYGDSRATAVAQLSDLRQMLQSGEVPDGQAEKLQQLVTTYDNYETFIRSHPGADTESKAARSNAVDMFNGWAQQSLSGSPLADVYNGIFRVLNTNFDKLNGG